MTPGTEAEWLAHPQGYPFLVAAPMFRFEMATYQGSLYALTIWMGLLAIVLARLQ